MGRAHGCTPLTAPGPVTSTEAETQAKTTTNTATASGAAFTPTGVALHTAFSENTPPLTVNYPLSLHDALPILSPSSVCAQNAGVTYTYTVFNNEDATVQNITVTDTVLGNLTAD